MRAVIQLIGLALVLTRSAGASDDLSVPSPDPHAILATVGKVVSPYGIDEAKAVEIGGIQQWITVRGRDRRKRARATCDESERSFRQTGKIVTMLLRMGSSQNSRLGQSSMQPWSPSGLPTVPHLQWGSHLAHFFASGTELRDVLVPYFRAGLENNERCLWVTGRAFNAEEARSALRAVVSDLDKRERDEQIEIANGDEWYGSGEKLDPLDLMSGLLRREQQALDFGYAGLRTNGNCAWVSPDQWADFLDYETLVQKGLRGRRMICMCSYCVDQLTDGSYLEVLGRHDLAVPSAFRSSPQQSSKNRAAVALSSAVAEDDTGEFELRRSLEHQKRTFDLAMVASDMGTWRYTLADNICVYDTNAQRLYGLTGARFLHDEVAVKEKFHPDDLDLMWSRVAKALDPKGDGHYDVEYRVQQLDGSWRWLSAWGLVEFEGEGPARRPVAIVGASRDLTKLKEEEELQRLLLNELNHRVKNTLATIQAISAQTLRAARDLPSARVTLDRRICSLARAHDLLTVRAWTGANLTDVVIRALDAFTPTQVKISGSGLDVSPRHALSLSMALHELATNATKYGALSCPEGRVSVQWGIQRGMLQLDWEESGGPPVAPPTKKGFGSRLLEDILIRDLAGHTKLIRCLRRAMSYRCHALDGSQTAAFHAALTAACDCRANFCVMRGNVGLRVPSRINGAGRMSDM